MLNTTAWYITDTTGLGKWLCRLSELAAWLRLEAISSSSAGMNRRKRSLFESDAGSLLRAASDLHVLTLASTDSCTNDCGSIGPVALATIPGGSGPKKKKKQPSIYGLVESRAPQKPPPLAPVKQRQQQPKLFPISFLLFAHFLITHSEENPSIFFKVATLLLLLEPPGLVIAASFDTVNIHSQQATTLLAMVTVATLCQNPWPCS